MTTRNTHIAEPRFAPYRAFDVSQFMVTRDWGRNGLESVTTPETSREGIILDIISGQIDRVVAVHEFNTAEAWINDITDDIKAAVYARTEERAA